MALVSVVPVNSEEAVIGVCANGHSSVTPPFISTVRGGAPGWTPRWVRS